MSKTACVGIGAVTVGAAFAATSVFTLGSDVGRRGSSANYGLLVFAMFAALCGGLAASSAEGRQRIAWISLTVGLAGWAVGVGALDLSTRMVLHQSPFPSLADAGYLLFPIGAGLAVVLFPTGHSGQSRTRFMLDGFIVAGALFEISWVLVLRSVYNAGGTSGFALGLSLSLPGRRHHDSHRRGPGARAGPHRTAHDAWRC